MKERVKHNEDVEPVQVFDGYKEAWASRVMNVLLSDFENGKSVLPKGFRIKGINMIEKEDGSFVVGFVVRKEAS